MTLPSTLLVFPLLLAFRGVLLLNPLVSLTRGPAMLGRLAMFVLR